MSVGCRFGAAVAVAVAAMSSVASLPIAMVMASLPTAVVAASISVAPAVLRRFRGRRLIGDNRVDDMGDGRDLRRRGFHGRMRRHRANRRSRHMRLPLHMGMPGFLA